MSKSRSPAPVSLAAIDLNLLVAFDALMSESTVTRAAARVGLTQSAMSHTLERLRKLFEDPLLVRSSQGMLPTSRALELVAPVRRALAEVTKVLADTRDFTSATARRTFTLAADDYSVLLIVPALYARLRAGAPDVDLRTCLLQGERLERQLACGEVDLALGALAGVTSRVLVRQRLLQDRYVCCMRAGHPASGSGLLSRADWLQLEHVSYSGDPVTKSRRVAATTHLLAAPLLCSQSDLFLTLPERVARSFARQLPLRVVELPLDQGDITSSALATGQLWHERQACDPEHVWLRSLIAEVCRDL